MPEVTVGIDVGTTSVKAVAVDGDGTILARARVPHALGVPTADRLEHEVDVVWRDGVLAALAEVSAGHDVAAVDVAAMVPSMAAVDDDGRGLTPGLLYGDGRGRSKPEGELVGFLAWLVDAAPGAAGYWPAQAVANHALCARGAIDSTVAMTMQPLYDFKGWDAAMAGVAGLGDLAKLPEIVAGVEAIGRTPGGALVGAGTIDAFAEQLVAGGDDAGDVLVLCGTTLITWAVIPEWREVPGLWTIPHTAKGRILIGGPSNAGGLFLDWARRLVGEGEDAGAVAPSAVPVFEPYIRGERTPLHDPDRRASLHGLDLTHGPAAIRRAAFEAAGFVVRHHLDLAALESPPRRIVASGGGSRVAEWVQALADCTGVPVDVVAVPEGGALGAAFLARCVAGLERHATDAARWARIERRVEPDERWVPSCAERYQRFRDLSRADPVV